MKLINAIITQREEIDRYGVAIDSLENTYFSYFNSLGVNLFPISNFQLTKTVLSQVPISLLILSGGGSVPNSFYRSEVNNSQQINRNIIEKELIEWAMNNKIPILAICRGFQYINALFGGFVSCLNNLPIARNNGEFHPVEVDGRQLMVNNFHNDGVYLSDLSSEFSPLALDVENQIVEMFSCPQYSILGFQWHPERILNKETDLFCREQILNLIQN